MQKHKMVLEAWRSAAESTLWERPTAPRSRAQAWSHPRRRHRTVERQKRLHASQFLPDSNEEKKKGNHSENLLEFGPWGKEDKLSTDIPENGERTSGTGSRFRRKSESGGSAGGRRTQIGSNGRIQRRWSSAHESAASRSHFNWAWQLPIKFFSSSPESKGHRNWKRENEKQEPPFR